MRVLLINQYYYPDIAATAQLCQDWAEDLVRRGHEVTVLAGTGRYRQAHRGEQAEPSPRLPHKETHRGVRIVRVPVWSGDGQLAQMFEDGGALAQLIGDQGVLARLLAGGGSLARLLGRGGGYASFLGGALGALWMPWLVTRPEVVVALSTPPMVAALGLCAQVTLGAGFVYWVQDVYPELLLALGVLKPSSPVARGLSALSKLLYRHADRVIALDQAMAARLVAAGAHPARVRVIDHFADTAALTPLGTEPPERSPVRQWLGLTDEFVVCYAGNHGNCHDFETVVAALAQQAKQGDRSLHWLFVGDGEQRQFLRSQVPAELQGVVHFLPPQARSELRAVLTAGSVGLVTLKEKLSGLVAPSKLYGLLSVGSPIVYVGPNTGRIPELLDAEELGVAIANGDAAGLLAALRRLQADPSLRAAMGARARELAASYYDRAHAAAAHAALLEEVAAQRAGRRA